MADGAEIKRLNIDSSFNFSCNKELPCFNLCCRDINLFLTPYDILRMKQRLKLTSADFLKTYAIPLFPKEVGHPVVLLRMVPDESRNCPFVNKDGCLIYEDRPWSCRSFPLEPAEGSGPPAFEIIRREFCMGFVKGKTHTVRKWRSTQNVAFYEEMNEEWRRVTHHEKFSSQDLLGGPGRDIFFLGSYNLDEFRNVVFKGDFQNYFDIDKKTLKSIKASDTELLRFAFGWLLHVLFGENTLKRR